MKKEDLVALLKSVSVDDLKNAIPTKEKMERLEKRKKKLEKDLSSVIKQIRSLQAPLMQRGTKAVARVRKRVARKAKGKRIAQPSLSSLVVEILKEKRKPLKINEICDALLTEKKYKTRAKDFKAQIRVMMYRNDKGLFKKAGPGLFKLAGDDKKETKTKKKIKTKTKKKTKVKTKKKTKR